MIGYQNQLIREIRASLPLLSYSSQQLIQGFHSFQAALFDLSQRREMKFYFASGQEDSNVPSYPGYLSHLVCEEAQIDENPKSFTCFFGLFNILIETVEKERPFDRILDDWIHRISAMN